MSKNKPKIIILGALAWSVNFNWDTKSQEFLPTIQKQLIIGYNYSHLPSPALLELKEP